MKVSLKNLKSNPDTWEGPESTTRHTIVIAGGKVVVRVKTWTSFNQSTRFHALISLFGTSSGYGQRTLSRARAIYNACEDAGVVFQGEPRDPINVMLKKLARSRGYRGKILIIEA